MRQRLLSIFLAIGASLLWACADHAVTAARMEPGQGTIAMQLVDKPSALDSIAAVNIFVVRVDARVRIADSAAADSGVDGDGDFDDRGHMHRDSVAWVTIASPNKAINILALQGADTALLGTAVVDTGHFHALRIVIDPAQSNIVLKNGTVLTATSTPNVEFFSRGRHGILVDIDNDFDVQEGKTTTVTIDFRLGDSILLRGLSIGHDGLLIRALVRAHCH